MKQEFNYFSLVIYNLSNFPLKDGVGLTCWGLKWFYKGELVLSNSGMSSYWLIVNIGGSSILFIYCYSISLCSNNDWWAFFNGDGVLYYSFNAIELNFSSLAPFSSWTDDNDEA